MIVSQLKLPASIPVLHRSIDVIERLAHGWPHSVNRLARELRLSAATCHRIVSTFETRGWVHRSEAGRLTLHPKLLQRLAHPPSPDELIAAVASPAIERLASTLHLGVKLSVRHDDYAVTLARSDPPSSPFSISGAPPGSRFHLCYGSSGAVLAAEFDEPAIERLIAEAPPEVWKSQAPDDFRSRAAKARRTGMSTDRGSFHPGVHTLSARVDTSDPTHSAVVTIIALPEQLRAATPTAVRRRLAQTAAEISSQLQSGNDPGVAP